MFFMKKMYMVFAVFIFGLLIAGCAPTDQGGLPPAEDQNEPADQGGLPSPEDNPYGEDDPYAGDTPSGEPMQ